MGRDVEKKRAARRSYYARNAEKILAKARAKAAEATSAKGLVGVDEARREFAEKGWYFDEELFHDRLHPGKDPIGPRRALIAKWKASVGCKFCREKYPGVLGFSRPEGRKMNRVLAQRSIATMRELAPLDIWCMNCRAKRIVTTNRHRLQIQQAKAAIGCAVCGLKDGAALQFHHPDEGEKLAEVSSFAGNRRMVALESAKCSVLCANCHMKLHQGALAE